MYILYCDACYLLYYYHTIIQCIMSACHWRMSQLPAVLSFVCIAHWIMFIEPKPLFSESSLLFNEPRPLFSKSCLLFNEPMPFVQWIISMVQWMITTVQWIMSIVQWMITTVQWIMSIICMVQWTRFIIQAAMPFVVPIHCSMNYGHRSSSHDICCSCPLFNEPWHC